MKILFVHQNFPGQFKNLAPRLSKLGHKVVALCISDKGHSRWNGIDVIGYRLGRGNTPKIHKWAEELESKVIRAEACMTVAKKLREQGYTPDVILAHPGWGESMFLKEVWPDSQLLIYCEYFYKTVGADIGFDPEFNVHDVANENARLRLKNLNNFMHFETASAGVSPTEWQASTYPEHFRKKITVIHDGVDTKLLAPTPNSSYKVKTNTGDTLLTKSSEVITFVNRTLEPYRGFHIFMRALPALLELRPDLHVIIIGGTDGGYGAKPTDAGSWKEKYWGVTEGLLSTAARDRVHFVGSVVYDEYIKIMNISSLHVYLTYPFVLSWSLLEAMSLGIPIIASNTGPVVEVIEHEKNGLLVDFFDSENLVSTAVNLLADKAKMEFLSVAARKKICDHYDLDSICIPRQLDWIRKLTQAG